MGAIAVVVCVIWNVVLWVHCSDEMSSIAKDGSGSWKKQPPSVFYKTPASHLSRQWKVVMHKFCECVIRTSQCALQRIFCKMECKMLILDWSKHVLLTWCLSCIQIVSTNVVANEPKYFAYTSPCRRLRHRDENRNGTEGSFDSVEQKRSSRISTKHFPHT